MNSGFSTEAILLVRAATFLQRLFIEQFVRILLPEAKRRRSP
jgi:hypothetical protein